MQTEKPLVAREASQMPQKKGAAQRHPSLYALPLQGAGGLLAFYLMRTFLTVSP